MGCVQTSSKPSEEEGIIMAEKILNFHTKSSSTLDLCFRKFSHNGALNSLQFSRAGQSLGIQICNVDQFIRITSTYNKIRDSQGDYKLLDLIIFAILLGTDSLDNKAKILFHCFDNDLSGFLETSQVKELLMALFKHSVDTLGDMVCDGQTPYTSELRNAKYLYDLNSVKKDLINRLTEFIMIGLQKVKEADFIERIVFFKDGKVLSSAGIRELLYALYLETIPRKKIVNGEASNRALRKTT